MQFTTLSVGLFAALATASQHVPQHFHHRRQYNGTSPSTTLTVYATEVYTITSCAASITDCPARASESTVEQVVTATVEIYTTVCPVAEASSASSAIISSYSASLASSTAAGVPTAPLGTGYPTKAAVTTPAAPYPTGGEETPSGPVGTGFTTKGEVVYPTASGSESVVLTYTLGSGTSTTVVTTTIKHTQTATVYATKPGSAGTPEESGSESAGVTGPASETGPTTTITGTSTSTRYITVLPATSGAFGAAGSSAAGECVPVTVTVTQATATVTVTESAAGYPTAAASGATTAGPVKEAYPTESVGSEIVSMSTATVIPVPVSTGAPYGNGTISTSTKKKCSSIFPSYSSAGVPVYPTGASSGIPSGVAVPTGSVYPSGAASPSAGYPVSSSSSSAEAGYPTVASYPIYV